jgi:hypothetical protein
MDDGQSLKSNHFVDVGSATPSRTKFDFKGGCAKSLILTIFSVSAFSSRIASRQPRQHGIHQIRLQARLNGDAQRSQLPLLETLAQSTLIAEDSSEL